MLPTSPQSIPVGTILVLLLTAALYVAMLINISFQTISGDAGVGEAAKQLLLIAGVWVLLAVLLIVGGVAGEMPVWAAALLVVLHPLSGWAVFSMIDLCTRGHAWAASFHVLLPVLTALYAIWARFVDLHALFTPALTSATLLGGIFVLSMTALAIAGPG